MKISSMAIGLWAFVALGLQAQTAPSNLGKSSVPAPTDYSVVRQDASSRVWQREMYGLGPSGQVVTNAQAYTEVASGLNYKDANGQWQPTREEIDIQSDGTAAAIYGQHQAYFPSDILNGEIELVTHDGKHLLSRPLGLSYDDGSNTVLIAALTNSVGQIINGNQVIYTNAFAGLDADLLYTYSKAGFQQDVLLRTRPPAPEYLGLNVPTTRLQLLTEFFNPPQPAQTIRALPEQGGMTLSDDTLDFGAMRMVIGKAFMVGSAAPPAMVAKSWLTMGGRQILVEAVPIGSLIDVLSALPATDGSGTTNIPSSPSLAISKELFLPPQRVTRKSDNSHITRLTQIAPRTKGLLLDYNIISSATNYIFQGDTTYYASGTLNLYGTIVFEGGAVIKYAANASLNIYYPAQVECLGASYRPTVFTAKDDNSVGAGISGSTGSPTGYYANPAIAYNGSATSGSGISLNNFKICYASVGVWSQGASDIINLTDGQMVNCNECFYSPGQTTVNMNNLLLGNFYTAVFLGIGSLNAVNVTFGTPQFNPPYTGPLYLVKPTGANGSGIFVSLTNCILANIYSYSTVTLGSLGGSYNGFYDSGSGSTFGTSPITASAQPFQTVGGGSFYLASASNFHKAGTNNIGSALLADIAAKTTYVPLIYSNSIIINNTVLGPYVSRDTNAMPDLGYHYDALDYAFGGCDLSTNLTFTNGAAVGWFYNNDSLYGVTCAILLNDGANLKFAGTATSPSWMARYATVQEGVNGAWPMGSSQPGVELNGDGAGTTPQLNGQFSKWSVLAGDAGHFQDYWALGNVNLSESEFYIANIVTYDMSSTYFTNCLFYRTALFFFDQIAAPVLTVNNCTLYGGILVGSRTSGQNQFWTIENTAFDGTGFRFTDYYNGGSSCTLFNYNSYNIGNLSGLSIPFPYGATTNVLEVVGLDDVMVTNYAWQSSWLGNFYLPSGSELVDAGDTNANLVGFFEYTTQATQAKEGTSIVDIGYHYVAVDPNTGLPYDTYTNGIPDYIADSNGSGLPDYWQIEYFGHLGVNPFADPDGDGLSNYEEYLYGTNPNGADTDGDGMNDALEIELGRNPLIPGPNYIWFSPAP